MATAAGVLIGVSNRRLQERFRDVLGGLGEYHGGTSMPQELFKASQSASGEL